jgi:hypothetical protein
MYITSGATSGTLVIDNISIKRIAGNHATQATPSARPVLSARVNLLTKTEQFNDAAWTKTNSTVTQNAATAPDGTLTADALYTTAATAIFVIGQNHTLGSGSTALIYAKENTTGFLQLSYNGDTTSYANFNLSTGVVGGSGGTATHTIESVGSGWYKCTVVNTSSAVTGIAWGIVGSSSATRRQTFTGTGAESIYIWGADLRVANDTALPVYQRVDTSTSYDTTGFPMYLRFDGSDDGMATSSIDFTGGDAMSVFAGVRKASDAGQGVVAELSATIASNNGTFLLAAPDGATQTFGWDSKGTNQVDAVATSLAAPRTAVLTGISDISSDICTIRVNGVQADTDASDQGTGNYGNYPLNIGARNNGASVRLNGRIYSLIVRAATTSAADVTSTETWINDKTKAY